MQKQAVLVCVICALAALLTISITLTLLKRGKEPEAPSSSAAASEEETPGDDLSDHYRINEASAALLTETADAGDDYLNDVLFLGDSNTVRLYNNGLISLQQFCAKEGIGTQAALNERIVTFKKDSNAYTIPEAVAKMKPRRVVMTFGTNDTGMEVSDFIANYTALVQAIQASYPYTDIIVNTVPPVPENHSNYPNIEQSKIDDFNMALLNMCEQLGVKFLNSAGALKGEDGYGIADYYNNGDIHLTPAGLKTVLNYIRTHAYLSEERRPDVNNIPTRTLEYSSNPSSAVQAPSSSSEAASSSETPASSASSESQKEDQKQYEVSYKVDKSGGGTLSIGKDTGKTSLKYTVTDSSKSLTVTAVPEENHVFVKWSDGVTSKTRKDTDFTENMDVTAIFAPLSLKITGERTILGTSINFRATINGKYGSADSIRWYANGVEVKEAAGHSSVTVQVTDTHTATYKVHAVITYNDCSVTSNTLTISIVSSSSSSNSSSSSSSSSSGASSGSTSSSSSESTSSASSTGSSHSSSHSSSSASTSSSSSSASSSHSTSSSASASEPKADSKTETASSSSKPASSESTTSASSSSHASSSSESSKTEASASTSKAE